MELYQAIAFLVGVGLGVTVFKALTKKPELTGLTKEKEKEYESAKKYFRDTFSSKFKSDGNSNGDSSGK